MNHDVYKEISDKLNDFELGLSASQSTYEGLHKAVSERVNFLISANLPLLLSFLYRLDISERKLKELLSSETDTATSDIIAALIIERQLQKVESRRAFKSGDTISEDEKW